MAEISDFTVGRKVRVVGEPSARYADEFPDLIYKTGTVDSIFGNDVVVIRFDTPLVSKDGMLTQEIMAFDDTDYLELI